MTVKHRWKRFGILMGMLLVLTFVLPFHQVNALETGSLTITGWNVDDTEFYLYKVADLDGTVFTSVNNRYSSLIDDKDIASYDNSELNALAHQLNDVIEDTNVEADQTITFHLNGKNTVSDLLAGLYVLKGETKEVDGITYIPQVSLISIPDKDLNYAVKTDLKYTKKEPSPVITPVPSSEPVNEVKTNDSFKAMYYTGILAIDAVVITLYFVLHKKHSKEGE